MKKLITAFMTICMVLTAFAVPTVSFAGGGEKEINVSVQGNGGTFSFVYDGEESEKVRERGAPARVASDTAKISAKDLLGSCVDFNQNDKPVKGIEIGSYWTEREFAGWSIFADKETGQVTLAEEVSAQDLMNTMISLKGVTDITIQAVWEGDDRDYMVSMNFDAVGGKFDVIYAGGGSDKQDGWGGMLKRNGVKIGRQLEEEHDVDKFMDPEKTGDTFEGWLKKDKNGNINFDKKYTFEEIEQLNVPSYNLDFIAKWAGMSENEYNDRFGNGDEDEDDGDDEDGNGGDGGPQVSSDVIKLEFSYYDQNGEMQYIAVEVIPDGKSTFRELFEKEEAKLKHHKGLDFKGFSYEGGFSDEMFDVYGNWDQETLMDKIAIGGLEIGAHAQYRNMFVTTEVQYYDTDNNRIDKDYRIIVAKEDADGNPVEVSYQAVLDKMKAQKLLPADKAHSSRYKFAGWAYGQYRGNDIDNIVDVELTDIVDQEYAYDWPFTVAAKYKSYPVTISYTRPVSDGKEGYIAAEPKTWKGVIASSSEVAASKNDKTLTQVCRGFLESEKYIWYVNPKTPITELGNPSPFINEIGIAAAVKESVHVPVFVRRIILEGPKDNIGYAEPEGVLYINEKGIDGNEAFDRRVEERALAVHSEKAYGFKVESYMVLEGRTREFQFPLEGYFNGGKHYSMEALYGSFLMTLKWSDSKGDHQEQFPVKPGSTYTLPYKNNHRQIWDIGGADYGGRFEFSGAKLKIEEEMGPVIYATSLYRLDIEELEKAPGQSEKEFVEIKLQLKEKALNDKKFVEAKTRMKYMDVELNQRNENGNWQEIHDGEFPQEGIVLYLPYPEGTSAETHDFSVTHFISSSNHPDKKKGEVEVLEVKETDKGLEVFVKSLSPIAIAYEDDSLAAKGKVVDTGDDFNAVPFIVIMVAAAMGAIAALLYRRKGCR